MLSAALLMMIVPQTTNLQDSRSPIPAIPLWQEFSVGMSPESVALTLRKIPGIKSVEVIRKRNKPAMLKTKYVNKGVQIGEMMFTIQPTFVASQLAEITLEDDSCASVGRVKVLNATKALKEKYGNTQRELVVDDQGVQTDTRYAFWNDSTRVQMSLQESNPGATPPLVYGGSGFQKSLADFANAMAESTASAAREACPSDDGRRMQITMTYLSQAAFKAEADIRQANTRAKAEALKTGL